ncbi:Bacteriophage abortive infection AbiH [Enterococcus malodoratus]|uniref:AbiH family protein n=1 Tax=Enterococcus malodoratus TaxID=71451 RepID=UPI0008CA2CFD|nr:AbiH family protein [Enterococcus malodoratus]SEU02785.1 Bacteriophage abortive infection AbiH [Enterococcus malodoratus]
MKTLQQNQRPSLSDEDHFAIVALARISHRKFKKYFGLKKGTADQRQPFFSSVLIEELRKYELCFQQYLANEIEQNNEYIFSCEDKLNELIKTDKARFESSNPKLNINVLSFNYTSPFSISGLSTIKISGLKNVHGSIDESNTIFGIDEFSDAAAEFVKFTKTYRTLSMTKNHSEKLYSKNLQTIKFFGHSLGEADYSYFQSIFDGIDLYGSDVKFIFYYSRFHEHENDNNNEDELQYQRITKLLKRYGETRENNFHGKNLMHKLILEGRISIVDL